MDGKARRLARIFPGGRTLIVPVDHAVTSGPLPGLADAGRTIERVLEGGPDAMLMHRGAPLAGVWGAPPDVALIAHLSAGTELSGRPHVKARVGNVEDAVALGADAVSVHVTLGTEEDPAALTDLGEVSSLCVRWGMPLLAMMYVHGEPASSTEPILHAARIAAELGADIVKVNHPGDETSLHELVASCYARVVIAGGPKASNEHELLATLEEVVAAGAAGACVGRNIHQHRDPAALTRACRAVVHEEATADEAAAELAARPLSLAY